MSQLLDRRAITADENERDALRDFSVALESHAPPRVITEKGEVEIPSSVQRVLADLVQVLMSGDAVTVVPMHTELTTRMAANFLNVSRPHLIQLLHSGKIPFHPVGSHRRIKFEDLVKYKEQRDSERRNSFSALVRASEEADLYAWEEAHPHSAEDGE
jgi:excisionase family DNA binding protein